MIFAKALLLACAAATVMAGGRLDYDALVSGARFTGEDTSQPHCHGVEVYRDQRNHPSAVASILLFSAEEVEFRPREKGVIRDRNVYDRYMRQILNFPGFRSQKEDTEDLDLGKSGGREVDRRELRKRIAEKYRSDDNRSEDMARSIVKMIPHELSDDNEDIEGGRGKNNQKWMLNHMVIHNERGGRRQLTIEIAAVELKLSRQENSDEVMIEPQTARMHMRMFEVDRHFLVENAQWLAKRIPTVTMNKFLEELSTNGRSRDDEDNDEAGDEEALEAWVQGSSLTEVNPSCSTSQRLYPIVSQWRMRV